MTTSNRKGNTQQLTSNLNRILQLGICLVLIGLATTASAEDLFKKKKKGLSSAFGTTPTSSPANSTVKAPELDSYVESRKFKDAKKLGEQYYSFTYEYEKWTIPASMSVSESGTNVWVTLLLDKVDDDVDTQTCSDNFMRLLNSNGKYGDFFFRYSTETKQISLYGTIQVRGTISPEDIDKHLEMMAKITDATVELWNTKTWSDAPMHVGSWKSDNGMQLTFNKNSQFKLASSTSNSSGNYEIASGRIVMTEKSGEKIEGSITFPNSNNFELSINGNTLKFVRM